jgi:hypothetical protein
MAQADDKHAVYGELEIARGAETSELSVYIVNNSSSVFRLPTGAIGGEVREGQMAGGATGLKVIPHVAFEWQPMGGTNTTHTVINLVAPIFTSAWTPHFDDEQTFTIPAGKRRFYYSFKVPTEYVRGKFAGGYLPRPDIYEQMPGYGTRELRGAIRITRLIDVTDKKAAAKRDASR